jgi:hypothetical protein
MRHVASMPGLNPGEARVSVFLCEGCDLSRWLGELPEPSQAAMLGIVFGDVR